MTKNWKEATSRAEIERVSSLLAAGENINSLDEHGQTALMNAAHQGNIELVHFLIKRGADLDRTAKHNLTALMLAVIANRPEAVFELISAGANLQCKGNFSVSGPKTARKMAEEAKNTDIIKIFEEFSAKNA